MMTIQNEAAQTVHAMLLPLAPRAHLMKCEGRDLPICATCCRGLAPDAGAGQRWITPRLSGASCEYFASVEKFASLFYTDTPPKALEAESDRGQPK